MDTEAPALRVLRLNFKGFKRAEFLSVPGLQGHLEELLLVGMGLRISGVWPRLKKISSPRFIFEDTERWAPCLEELYIVANRYVRETGNVRVFSHSHRFPFDYKDKSQFSTVKFLELYFPDMYSDMYSDRDYTTIDWHQAMIDDVARMLPQIHTIKITGLLKPDLLGNLIPRLPHLKRAHTHGRWNQITYRQLQTLEAIRLNLEEFVIQGVCPQYLF